MVRPSERAAVDCTPGDLAVPGAAAHIDACLVDSQEFVDREAVVAEASHSDNLHSRRSS